MEELYAWTWYLGGYGEFENGSLAHLEVLEESEAKN